MLFGLKKVHRLIFVALPLKGVPVQRVDMTPDRKDKARVEN
jgi:hypothetical protein